MLHAFEQAQGSLVLFTLFTQAAVGAFWVLLVNDFLYRRASERIYDAFTRIGTGILVPLTALGLLFSTTHLGRPQYAWRALFHVGSSWLSREVWAFGLFFVLVALYTYLWWRRSLDAEVRRLVGAFTGVVGLLAVLTQAQVYQIPGRPMWHHPSTSLLFLASAFVLGPLAVAVVYNLAWGRLVPLAEGEPVVRTAHRRLGMTLLAAVVPYALSLAWRVDFLQSGAAAAAADPRIAGWAATGTATRLSALLAAHDLMAGPYAALLRGQVLLSLLVPVALAVGLWYLHRRGASLRLAGGVIGLGLAAVLVGEILGRALFYLTGVGWF